MKKSKYVLPTQEEEWKGEEHYRAGGIEVLDVMRAKMQEEQLAGFYLGSIIKYALRLNYSKERLTDMKKLHHYAALLIELMEEKEE